MSVIAMHNESKFRPDEGLKILVFEMGRAVCGRRDIRVRLSIHFDSFPVVVKFTPSNSRLGVPWILIFQASISQTTIAPPRTT